MTFDIDNYSPIKQKHIIYNDSDNGRTYTVDIGNDSVIDLKSVTTFMDVLQKPALVPWAYNVGVKETFEVMRDLEEPFLSPEEVKQYLKERERDINAQKNKGGTRGTAVHHYLECEIKGIEYDVDPAYTGYWDQVRRFLDDYQPEFYATEIAVVSLEHEYAGRLDNLCKITAHPPRRRHRSLIGESGVMDLKSNKEGSVYPRAHLPQVEAYKHGVEEMTIGSQLPFDLSFALVVAVGQKRYTPCVSYANLNTFLAVKNAYDALNTMERANPNGRK
jgi:hypothetical protein